MLGRSLPSQGLGHGHGMGGAHAIHCGYRLKTITRITDMPLANFSEFTKRPLNPFFHSENSCFLLPNKFQIPFPVAQNYY